MIKDAFDNIVCNTLRSVQPTEPDLSLPRSRQGGNRSRQVEALIGGVANAIEGNLAERVLSMGTLLTP